MTIIGVGSGRSGTQSLAKVLDLPHELPPEQYYEFDEDTYQRWKAKLGKGDVALYHGWHLERYFKDFEDLKVVCMRRNKHDTVESFLSLMKGTRNHWHTPIEDEWDKRFPTYDYLTKQDAIAQYWEDYYAHIEDVKKKYPIFTMELEMFDDKRKEMFDFLEIPEDKRDYRIIRTNQREHHVAYRIKHDT